MSEAFLGLRSFRGSWSDAPAGSGVFGRMGVDGDTKYTWDKTKPAEVEAARAAFDVMIKKGYCAFRMRADGSGEEQLRVFDPAAERILFTPQMQGG